MNDNDFAQLAALWEQRGKVNDMETVDELKARIRRLEAARDAYQESREQLNVLWMQERARVEALEAALEAENAAHNARVVQATVDMAERLYQATVAAKAWKRAAKFYRGRLAMRPLGGEGLQPPDKSET